MKGVQATISSEADSMDDEVLAYPISELQPHKVRLISRLSLLKIYKHTKAVLVILQVGPKTFVLSFLTSAPINASHTLPIPLFDGIVHGPYLPSTIPKQMLVPQLLNLRWLYRPSSPEPTPHDDDDDEKETVLEPTPSKTEKMLPGDSSSSPATIGFPTSGSTLKLITQLSSGRLWDTFSALLTLPLPSSSSSACDNNNQDKVKRGVIVKTTCPVTFPSDPTVELYTESQARRAILTEDRVYRALSEGQHPEVMNQIVPVYHGLWGGVVPMSNRWGVQAGREIWAMVLEDCGQAVELDGLKRDDKFVSSASSYFGKAKALAR